MHRRLLPLLALLAACGPRELRVTMNGDNNSGQEGTAVLTALGRGLTVVIETNAPRFEGAQQTAHIHPGTCGEVGPPRVDLSLLGPLEGKPGRWGSTTTVEEGFGFEDLATGEWAVNVHDARERTVWVSCGEIPRP